MQKVDRNEPTTGFSIKDRNFGGWWGGLYRQKLNTVQSVALLILVVFYVGFFVVVVAINWPLGAEPLWQKIVYGISERDLPWRELELLKLARALQAHERNFGLPVPKELLANVTEAEERERPEQEEGTDEEPGHQQ